MNDAERMIEEAAPVEHTLEENYQLFQSIMEWARRHDVLMGARFEWMVKELLDLETNHVIIAGMSGSGKTEFVQELLGDHVKAENTTATVMYKHADYKELTSISDTAIIPLDSMDDLRTGEKDRNKYWSIINILYLSYRSKEWRSWIHRASLAVTSLEMTYFNICILPIACYLS